MQSSRASNFSSASQKADLCDSLFFCGSVSSDDVSAENDYCVKINLSENDQISLNSNQHYFFQFTYANVSSRVGRFRTLPGPQQDISNLRLGVVTCQDYSSGFFTAYGHLAEEKLDFVVHLGDFIYEYDSYPHKTNFKRRVGLKHHTAIDLKDFRQIHETYRRDPHLQRALEEHTFIYTWDDHETANNHHYNPTDDTYNFHRDHPLANESAEARRKMVLEARKARLEYTPMAVCFDDMHDPYNYYKIYRKYKFGTMLEMMTTDSRTYREPNQDTSKSTMLGQTQKNWLQDSLINSNCKWRVWANQTLFSELAIRGPLTRIPYKYINLDAWDGFRAEREEILESLEAANVDNLVVLTGDMHSFVSSYVKKDLVATETQLEIVLGSNSWHHRSAQIT